MDSALHAPAAGFGDHEVYPDLIDKAAVLAVHLVKNHALPDANKRTSFITMIVSLNATQAMGTAGRRRFRRHRWLPLRMEPSVLSGLLAG